MPCTGVLVATTDLYNTNYLKTSIFVEFEASIGISPRNIVMDADSRETFPCEPYVAALECKCIDDIEHFETFSNYTNILFFRSAKSELSWCWC